jgi:hypothetical protein
MIKKKYLIGMSILLVGLILLSSVSAYTRAVTSGMQYSNTIGIGAFGSGSSLQFDKSMCEEGGTDLLIQIVPFGCTPAVVRSDLLEEQDVQVYCQLGATQINPLIEIEAIDYLSFAPSQQELSEQVRSVGYFPSRAALGTSNQQGELNSPILSDLGYVVITIKKQPNESQMPEYVQGNLTAKVRYDITNAFGVGNTDFYLKEMSDEEWNEKYIQYSFWEGRGYLRALSVDNEGAQIVMYSDDTIVSSGTFSKEGRTYSKSKYASFNLAEGEKSDELYLPGFSPCLATLTVTLQELVNPDTRVKLKVGSDYIEVAKGEKFLDNKCYVRDIKKEGLYQSVKIYCKEDKPKTVTLGISPRVKLKIDGEVEEYEVGDWLYKTPDGEKSVYLGYVGSWDGSELSEDLYIYLFAAPEHKEKLDANDLASVNAYANTLQSGKTGAGVYDAIVSGVTGFTHAAMKIGKWTVVGEDFYFIPFKHPKTGGVSLAKEVKGKDVSIVGFGEGEDQGILKIEEDEYTLEKDSSLLALGRTIYRVKEGTEKTGLIVEELKTDLGESRLILGADNILAKATVLQKYGAFYSETGCKDYSNCPSNYTLSTNSEFDPPSNLDDFFENLIGAKIIPKENKLIVERTIFTDSPDESFNKNYQKAMEDFQTVESSFSGEQDSENSLETYGERALYEAIALSIKLNKKRTTLELCEEFKDKYDESILYPTVLSICEDDYRISSDELSTMEVSMNGRVKEISLLGIDEPGFEEYGVELYVRGPNGVTKTINLEKNKEIKLNGFRENEKELERSEYVMLNSLETESADLFIYVADESVWQKGFASDTKKLEIDTPFPYGGYVFTLKKINLEKSAKVAIRGNTNFEYSEVDFNFKVGIEKRSFPLTPEKAASKIENLNKQIESIEKVSNTLAGVVKTWKYACTGTAGFLTFKNMLSNMGGKSIARQKVMQGEDGWTERCKTLVEENPREYPSLDSCFYKNADKIDAQVEETYKYIQFENQKIKQAEEGTNTQEGWIKDYSDKTLEDLSKPSVQQTINDKEIAGTKTIDFQNINNILTEGGFKSGVYSTDQLKEIGLYAEILNNPSSSTELKETATKRLYTVLRDVQVNSQTYSSQISLKETSGLASSGVWNLKGIKTTEIPIYYIETFANSKYSSGYIGASIDRNKPVYVVEDETGSGTFLLTYEINGDTGVVEQTYKIEESTKTISVYSENSVVQKNPFNVVFKRYDENSLKNPYKNPELKYYEEEPNKGNPAIVPLDKAEGWYAATKPMLTSETLKAYDDSGRIEVFWICNVGRDGLEDFFSTARDDNCEMINLRTGQALNQVMGLSENKASALIEKARRSIEEAQRAYASGASRVRIGGVSYNVGSPAVSTPAIQCQDFMSPKECQILFNVCDPVVCPSSRCDLGGTYPVQDVIQSGVIGSIALCLPNAKEGIVVPICVSGVQTGLDGFLSVQKSYRDCLQHNIETGETVGICDEVYSIYICDFFWRQALPLAKLTIPKILSAIFKENPRGGGEYLGVKDALSKAQDSIEFFKGFYAENSWKAFKLRSVDEVGTEVCKSFPSVIFPGSGDFLDSLTDPDSPTQYTGKFQEIVYTTITNPPTSHYKVSYHIYAGKDTGVYYQVSLKQGTGSSYYQDTMFDRKVASGYIPAGEYATNSTDFTAPSGFKYLCITVNGKENCDFEQVSTSFAVNYMSELYIQEQTTTQVKTEEECISGTASLYSLLNPNIQNAAEEILDPKIYENGIIRVCATESPGKGTDSSWEDPNTARWTPVGYCGDTKVKCWLDRDKVKEIVHSLNIENDILSQTATNYENALFNEGDYLTTKEFKEAIEDINDETYIEKKIEMIDELWDVIFFNNQKAKLFLMRGQLYSALAIGEYMSTLLEAASASGTTTGGTTPTIPTTPTTPGGTSPTNPQAQFNAKYISPYLEFNDKSIFPLVDNCYRYYNSKWQWAAGCDGGMWNDVDSYSEDISSGRANKVGSKFEDIIFALQDKDGDYVGGLTIIVSKILNDNNAELSDETFSYTTLDEEGIFTVEFSDPKTEPMRKLYYKYEGGDWFWQIDEDFVGGGIWQSMSNVAPGFNDEQKDIANMLKDSDLYEGAAILFDYSSEDILELFLDETTGGTTTTNTNTLDSSLQKRDLTKLTNLMKALSTSVLNTQFKCYCGTDCDDYAKWIVQYSSASNIPDELLLLAIMVQESSCRSIQSSDGGDNGLMQINTIHCGTKGLPSDINQCKSILLSNEQLNINIGAQVLKGAYSPSSKIYTCINPMESYSGWEHALRGYNGWNTNCSKGDPNYVEKVKEKYFALVQLYNGNSPSSGTGSTPSSCDNTLVGNEILSIAESKIGQDTTRIESGAVVYDNVCATFVSNVLIEADTLPQFQSCTPNTIPYRDAIVELIDLFDEADFTEIPENQWQTGLEEGDLIIWGGSGSYDSEYQHITIFSNYASVSPGITIIHDGGQYVNISSKTYTNPFGTNWYITHVWRAKCA